MNTKGLPWNNCSRITLVYSASCRESRCWNDFEVGESGWRIYYRRWVFWYLLYRLCKSGRLWLDLCITIGFSTSWSELVGGMGCCLVRICSIQGLGRVVKLRYLDMSCLGWRLESCASSLPWHMPSTSWRLSSLFSRGSTWTTKLTIWSTLRCINFWWRNFGYCIQSLSHWECSILNPGLILRVC